MIIKSFIRSKPNLNSLTKYSTKSLSRPTTKLYSTEPLNGIEIGIPLNIFSLDLVYLNE